ncbi:uncharacterized GPI-anchored protein At3g06035 [Cornus florida]|uniref:uncharacterized GPI-anchored protein At3g06035 n=1 Tax=Cornus florida TaxID=4283 RepID=UPI00289A66C9|nr:uncharacterized GPI-anchored protein At3g06035 [Cornus florida]
MAFLRYPLSLFLVLNVIVLLSNSVICDDKENDLLQGINRYRSSLGLPPLAKNDNAECLADEIADKLEDQPCTRAIGTVPEFSNYPDALKKCHSNVKTTKDGVILPVCVPNRVPTLVLTNYTHSPYATYLNKSKYTGVGIGSEDDWMVVVLATNTPAGNFVSGAGLAGMVGVCHFLLSLLLALSVVV